MKNFTLADLEALARGRSVGSDAFRAIFADPDAVTDLAQLLQVRELVGGPAAEIDPGPLVRMDVTFDELARHGEGRLHDPERVRAVERFLAEHFPESLAQPRDAGGETVVDYHAPQGDTVIQFGSEAGKKSPPGAPGAS
jgi:hypothetical protein